MIRRQHILLVVSVSLVTLAMSLLFTDTSFSRPTTIAPWYLYPDSTKTVTPDSTATTVPQPVSGPGVTADSAKNATNTVAGPGTSTDTTKKAANAAAPAPAAVGDTIGPKLKYPIQDREGDFLTNPDNNPFKLKDPGAVVKKVDYDPVLDRYILTEQVDGHDVKPPVYMTFQDYLDYERQESIKDYYRERANSMSLVEKQGLIPKLTPKKRSFGEIFGPGGVEIRPSGNVDITFGGNWQKIDNPILTEAARKQGGFNFDMHINMNVVGSIGDKLKINLAYNTGATFDFENQIKLKYEGKDDDIIKSIEAGNVSFPLKTTLIQGPTSLFGVKTKLQFGRLTISTVFSQQKSKSQNLTVQNGSQVQTFQLTADQYDENRHFFLAQAFKDNYDHALSTLPNINSLYNVTRIEVWVTNKTGATQNVRNIVTFADLGENNPAEISCNATGNCWYYPTAGHNFPDNSSNNLYAQLIANPTNRNLDNIVTFLTNKGSQQSQDFEKTFGRELAPTEFTFNPQLGYISLNTVLAPDDVLGVAYQYTYNGNIYQVGDFAEDIPPDSTSAGKVLYLKMLKATAVRPALPMWNLMMKNIYSLGAFQVNAQNFNLQIYYQDPGGGILRYIPAQGMDGRLLLQVLNLDNLNTQLDPQPDGIFDFIPGITINPANGRIIFPVLQPFGEDLRKKFPASEQQGLADSYIYTYLYDSTKVVAQQHPELDRYIIKGSYSSSSSSDISLGAFNIPPGSVKVTAGGVQLVEGKDFTVDYSLGRVKILNQAILNAGTPINISFENNALFGFQTKTLFGNRLDYAISDKFGFGFTQLHLKERPFTQKVNIGDDPISNTIWGLDMHYNTESEFITWLLDKIPFYHTKEKSTFGVYAEMARLKPGHPSVIGSQGQVYIDDFEGASSNYDLRYPAISWHIASTPQDAQSTSKTDLFPESHFVDSLPYAYNRAHLCWYNIDPLFQVSNSATPGYINTTAQSQTYVRAVAQTEVFPNQSVTVPGLNNNILTFDMAYYPKEKGMYNYESTANGLPGISAGLNPDGSLKEPTTRWGGIMRSIDNTDFEAANVEYMEFWLMNPFQHDSLTATGGQLYLNLGDVCEDVERDSRLFFENALPVPGTNSPVNPSVWGEIPLIQPIVNSFDNDPNNRALQDIGLDGLNDAQEQVFFAPQLNAAANVLNPTALAAYKADPSNDDYHYYLGSDYDNEQLTILQRYKKYNGTEGNSPVQNGNALSNAETNIPDAEDINHDNSLNEAENYYQYRIDLEPSKMFIGINPYITDILDATSATLPNNTTENIKWYQFQIPINSYNKVVGNITDFRSIRFMRMFLTGWSDSVILRFAELALVRNQWRTYTQSLLEPGEYIPSEHTSNTTFNVGAVSVEANSSRTPVPYLTPPGVYREQNLNAVNNVNALLNEQSLDVQVCNLQDGDARAVYKDVNLDLRVYKRLQMFVHGEANSKCNCSPMKSGDVQVFVRMGSDFTQNYYEYSWPLDTTGYNINLNSTTDTLLIWPTANNLDIPLDSFVTIKLNRDKVIAQSNIGLIPYSVKDPKGNTYTIVGEPDLGVVKSIMLGIRNPKATANSRDDGLPKCVDVWFDELRLNGLDEKGGWAANARVESQLADLGNVTFAANMHTVGFGQLEDKVDQRDKDNLWAYNFATTLELGKFFPTKWGLRLPMFVGYSASFSTPEYDPYELDVPLSDKFAQLALLGGDTLAHYRRQVQTYQRITSLNFTNVRVVSQKKTKKPHLWDISNFNVTYAYTETLKSDPQTLSDVLRKYRGNLNYNFAPKEKSIYPFKKLIRSSSKWLDIIRDINFNPYPNNITFSTTLNRQFGETEIRPLVDETYPIAPTFNKFFNWDRTFAFKYNPFKSLTLDFSSIDNARIDEPDSILNTKAKRDTMWNNFLHGGRNVHYQQTANASYNLPIDKIPLFDWIQIKAAYNTSYSWTAGPLIIDSISGRAEENPFGNTLANAASGRLNGEFNFKNIYDKFNWLKPYNNSTAKREDKESMKKKEESNKKKREGIKKDLDKAHLDLDKAKTDLKLEKKSDDDDDTKSDKIDQLKKKIADIKKKIKKLKADRKKILDPENPYISPFIRPIIMLKRISASYTEAYTTTLPGFMPNASLFGQSNGLMAPGPAFAFGFQPGDRALEEYANKGWISTDTNLNYQFIQTYSQNINLKATLEPFRDFRVDLTMVQSESQNYSEYFKREYSTDDFFSHLTPQAMGSYTISYISIKTAFQGVSNAGITQAYTNFETYRAAISQRLGKQNPNSNPNNPFVLPADANGNPAQTLYNFRDGYGPYSQDVLIPAFIAAYTGISPDKVKLDPFNNIPRPNWRITYNGLSKFKFLAKIVKNVVISHAYNSTLTLSGYQSNLYFTGNGYLGPSSKDSSSNFISKYNIPQITITEQFAPLIGVDITWFNGMTTKFDFKKSRNLSMSFVGYALSESHTTEVTFGFGYLLKGLKFGNLKIRGKPVKLENNINFACDVSYRNNITVSQLLDQDISQPTSGAKTIIVSPYITYIVSKRLRVKIFFERNRTIPATSASFPITNTKAGITLSFSLTP